MQPPCAFPGRYPTDFSSWVDVFGTSLESSIAGAAALVRLLRTKFATFGVPDEISTDSVPKITAFCYAAVSQNLRKLPSVMKPTQFDTKP